MAIIEKSGLMKYKNKAGDVYIMRPITSADNVEGLDDSIAEARVLSTPVAATSTDGVAYIATVPGITALTTGFSFIMVPNKISSSVSATLNVNGLGAKALRVRVSGYSGTTSSPATANWLAPNKPVRVTYDGMWWIADVMLSDGSGSAEDISYSNTSSGLTATDVQAAIDELANSTPSSVQNHISNTTIHITATERTAWNNKADKSYVNTSIQEAIQNSWEASY